MRIFKNPNFGKVLILGLIIFIALEVIYYGGYFGKSASQPNTFANTDQTKLRDTWSKRIDEVSAEKSYQEFKDTLLSLKEKDKHITQHQAAHVFGELLYQKVGTEGVGICDDSFDFGCFHSFFLSAISDQSLDVVYTLDQACIKRFGEYGLGCQHGIGHGILGYLGQDKLEQALEICSTLTWKRPIAGCAGGVFMEYFFPTLDNHKGIQSALPRAVKEDDIYYPCQSLKKEYDQITCYNEISFWWESAYSRDYQKLGELCSKVGNKTNQNACFLGLGQVIGPSLNYQVTDVIQTCQRMPDLRSEAICRSGASWSFYAGSGGNQPSAPTVCENLSGEYKEFCLQKEDIAKEPNF